MRSNFLAPPPDFISTRSYLLLLERSKVHLAVAQVKPHLLWAFIVPTTCFIKWLQTRRCTDSKNFEPPARTRQYLQTDLGLISPVLSFEYTYECIPTHIRHSNCPRGELNVVKLDFL